MIKYPASLVVCVIAFCLSIPATAKTSLGTVSEMIGIVQIKRDGDSTWTKARPRMPVFEKDAIKTKEESRCEIAMVGDRIIRIAENSIAVIASGDTAAASITAQKGSLWCNVKKITNRSFDVGTPTAVASIRGTVFGIECNPNAAKYLVLQGAIAVTSKSGTGKDSTFTVSKGQQIDLVKDMNLYIKDQQKAIAQFMEDDAAAFEKFQKDDQAELDKYNKEQQDKMNAMLAEERKAFKEINGVNCALRTIDQAKLGKSEWAAWNQKRDAELGW